jgi:hypothetical protein
MGFFFGFGGARKPCGIADGLRVRIGEREVGEVLNVSRVGEYSIAR